MSYKLTEKEQKEAEVLLARSAGMTKYDIVYWLSGVSLRDIILLCKILECSIATVDSAIIRYWGAKSGK